ncbi:MAG: tetratricopeptide repeat protein [Micromonosporaceae bacterium]|nr:tetratricopeptide repeat protein [Micromonosporaceae bacterium]
MWFALLGPLTVYDDAGLELTVGGVRLRVLLAALLLNANKPVPADVLAEAVWDATPPPAALQTLRSYVRRLRSALGPAAGERVVARTPGYLVRLLDSELDVLAFDRLCREASAARRGADWDKASTAAAGALELWRGTPLMDIRSQVLRDEVVPRLEQLRLQALEDRVEADLHLGRQERLVPLLSALTAEYPLREHFHAQHIIALCRCGRQADALAAYQDARRKLVDELGIEPGPELRRLHERVLAGDADLLAPPAAGVVSEPAPAPGPVPHQLPAAVRHFTGRPTELDTLLNLAPATDGGARAGGTVVISAIDGMAGVGKTALAVQAAHQMLDRYPDGQVFIDLHGYTEGVAPIDPGEALDRMLRALGVAGDQIPADVDERAGLYRSRLADQRVLIVLDNAATEAQVTPLLPGAPGCVVLVTSRQRLSGLDHAHTLSLDTLPPGDAVALLRQTAGESRLTGQPPDLVAELIELCGRLPLAIRIAAARLRSHPTWDLSHLVRRLRDQQHRLVELAAGQRTITAALDLSYQHLSADLQGTYRRLGLHPGGEIDPYAAAALLDTTLPEADRMLEQLLEANLLQEAVPGRYRFHDLTRAHAAYTASRDETEDSRHSALDRLLDFYRCTTAAAMDAAYPYEREYRPQVPPATTPSPTLSQPSAALDWLDSELPNVLASARYANEHDRPTHLLHLSTILHQHLRNRGPYHDALTLHQQALTTARAASDQAAELDALNGLGNIHRRLGRRQDSTDHHSKALQLAHATGHRAAELDALNGLGHIHLGQDRYQQAIDHFQQALRLARDTGHRPGELDARVGLGHIHRLQGRYQQAIDHFQQALRLARDTGHRAGEMNARVGLGHIHRLQGRYEEATDHFQQALQLARDANHRHVEQTALTGLGHIHRLQGRYQLAIDDYQRLLDLARQSGSRNWQFEARQGLGRLQLASGYPDIALTHHQRALTLATELGQTQDQARAHDGLAHAHHALHQPEQARTHWQHALDILTRQGIDHTDEEETTITAIRAHLATSTTAAAAAKK